MWLRPADQAIAATGGSIVYPLGGQFRLDPGLVVGWGIIGPADDTNTQNLGTDTATDLNRVAGGVMFPFPVNLKRFRVWHRNNNSAAEAWGWVIHSQAKTDGSNAIVQNLIVHETQANGNVGPRNYGNLITQLTDLDLTAVPAAQNIPAGDVIGVAVSAPTAAASSYYVQVMAGYLEFEAVY